MSFRETEVTEFSIPLPRALDTRIFIRLAVHAKAVLLFLTSASPDQSDSGATAMGSFVYALPDRLNSQQPLATTLFSSESSVEFATRIARIIARRAQMPVYVTNSVSFESAGMGGTVEEELEAFKNITEAVLDRLSQVLPDQVNSTYRGLIPRS
ncbi:hypothetical protein ESCO_006399 [Escovopsis weberi]|uniref:Proteasome assembly chaperone 4 n=1 Tax=Escovopsis weberi TaxID=150374 RepID=A0A0M8N0R4_ESCWE|nr:hypothetical protein ESCO_006399 [Escovopsis weberi]